MHYSNHTDANNKIPFSFDFAGKNVTRYSGLGFIMSFLRKKRFFKPFVEVLNKHANRPWPLFDYTNQDMIEQIIAANVAGCPDYQDADDLALDPLFSSCCSKGQLASAPTLCRFYNRVEELSLKQQTDKLRSRNITLEELAKHDADLIRSPVLDELNQALSDDGVTESAFDV